MTTFLPTHTEPQIRNFRESNTQPSYNAAVTDCCCHFLGCVVNLPY
jgi:hypothetical protein